VGDGLQFADGDTGWWFGAIAGFAGSTMVTNLLSFFMFYKSHWFFTKNVYFIRPHFENSYRAHLHTLAATITLVCVQNEIPVSGPIIKTVVGNHIFFNIQ
jgi:hypothetical protein